MAAGQTSCGTCGTEPRPGARFCDACGSPITQDAAQTEHKQVTVLFADVVGSMDLAARLDSERLREVMAELFHRCGAVVEHYGGTVDKFTGDGIMALFGAPIALEDHAIRACLAALEIQQDADRLAAAVHRREGIRYALRVGLNSGDVVAGQIGGGPTSYTAVGAQVGMAQRMESAAPPGGVMVSESTARLVEDAATLGPPQMVAIKGAESPVPARRLLAMGGRRWPTGRTESRLIGRTTEMAAVDELLDRALGGSGSVIAVAGPAGIGKSRIARELSETAQQRGLLGYSTFCESHANQIPFHVIARLLRDVFGIGELDNAAARSTVRTRLPSAEPDDVLLLEDLLGIRDSATVPNVSADARRRRLSQLLNTALTQGDSPVLVTVEDAHWIDGISEAILAEVLPAVYWAASVAVITFRPEYHGVLLDTPGLRRIVLAPLGHSEAEALTGELVGPDPSVAALKDQIVAHAAGNPFFVHEIVRDLAERRIIEGRVGAYERRGEFSEVTVPPTLQATIAARIDRLTSKSKRVLNAAAVIGARFTPGLLTTALDDDDESVRAALTELVNAELVEHGPPGSSAEHAFRHPLIRTVANESQLASTRRHMHRRLAEAIRARGHTPDESAAVIGGHLEAAGDLREAHAWYMRAGSWFTNRDIGAARIGWEAARRVADRLPADAPDRAAMRIAPRSLLCGSAWRANESAADIGFDELSRLCTDTESRIPLAMGMAGLLTVMSLSGNVRESYRRSAEYVALVESIGDPALTVGLLYAAIYPKYATGDMTDVLHLSQRVIDLADGDPTKGNVLTGSPLAFAIAMRGVARCCLGRPGWRADFDEANAIARDVDPTTFVSTVMFKNVTGIAVGALVPDATAMAETREALETALRCSEDLALGLAQIARGLTLVHAPAGGGDRAEGFRLLAEARAHAVRGRSTMHEVGLIDVETAAEMARVGDVDGAIEQSRQLVDDMVDRGTPLYLGTAATVLVTSLLERDGDGDALIAQRTVERLADVPVDPDGVHLELPILHLSALVARHRGDDGAYRDFADRYRTLSAALGFDAHIAIASAMQ